jgi:hypothetical protein
VKRLMHLYWNMRLLDNMPLDLVGMFESLLELDEDDDFVASLRSAVGDEEEDDDEGDDEDDDDDGDEVARVEFYD